MKNKRLIWTLIFLAILTLGSIGTDLFKKEHQDANKVVKVGILQFVTHDALDQIEKGIEDGLKEAGYKGDKVKITLLNAEGDQSKIQTMSKQLVNDKNDVVIGIATPAAQGLAATKVAKIGFQPKFIRVTATAPPRGKEPSVVKSGKSKIRKVM